MIYFSSDHHFWHANVIKYCNRPYFSVEEMNEDLIARHNEVVKPNDTFICLGDFSFSGRSVELYSQRLNGIKYLVPGNHDPLHPYNKHYKKSVKNGEPWKWPAFYRDHGWTVLPLIHTMKIEEFDVTVCHMPFKNTDNEYGNKYKDYAPDDKGQWLLCGHVHEKWKVSGRMFNVGVDVHDYKPISEAEIARAIRAENAKG